MSGRRLAPLRSRGRRRARAIRRIERMLRGSINEFLGDDAATRYFAARGNADRRCPTDGCDGLLEYTQSEVREGERCPVCGYWTFGRK